MCDTYKFGKEKIEAKIHLNKSSISTAMSTILIMYLQDKYNLMSMDEKKEIENYFYEYKIYDKFDRIIKKCDGFAKEIAKEKD